MHEHQEQMWIEELKIDFPEYAETIDRLDWEVEQFLELIEDYYICKERIRRLEKSEKNSLMGEFIALQVGLKLEIRLMLSAKCANP